MEKEAAQSGGAAAATGAGGRTLILEKGMIRYLYVVLDMTSAMDVTDIRPSRRMAMLQLMEVSPSRLPVLCIGLTRRLVVLVVAVMVVVCVVVDVSGLHSRLFRS